MTFMCFVFQTRLHDEVCTLIILAHEMTEDWTPELIVSAPIIRKYAQNFVFKGCMNDGVNIYLKESNISWHLLL